MRYTGACEQCGYITEPRTLDELLSPRQVREAKRATWQAHHDAEKAQEAEREQARQDVCDAIASTATRDATTLADRVSIMAPMLAEDLVKAVAFQKLEMGTDANNAVYQRYAEKLYDAIGADAVRVLANIVSRAGHIAKQRLEQQLEQECELARRKQRMEGR